VDRVPSNLSELSSPLTTSTKVERQFDKYEVQDLFSVTAAARKVSKAPGASRSFDSSDFQEVSRIYRWCYKMSNSYVFSAVFGVLIFVNVVLVTLEAQTAAGRVGNENFWPNVDLDSVRTADHVFTGVFFVEIAIRIFGSLPPFWHDHWLVLDTLVLIFAFLDIILIPWDSSSLFNVSKVIRCLRALRAVRVLRLFRFVRQLRVLTECLGEALKSVMWVLLLMILWAFCFSVLMCVLWSDVHVDDWSDPSHFFTSVGKGILVLIQVSLQGFEWGPDIVEASLWSDEEPGSVAGGIAMIIFVVLTLVFAINVAKGIFVSNFFGSQKNDDAMIDRAHIMKSDALMKQTKQVFLDADVNHDGRVTWSELVHHFEAFPNSLKALGVESAVALRVFQQIDEAKKGYVELDQFLIGTLKATRTGNNNDMLSVEYQQQKILKDLRYTADTFNSGSFAVSTALLGVENELSRVLRLVDEVSEEVMKSCVVPDEDQKMKEFRRENEPADVQVIDELEDRFRFKSRLGQLEVALRGLARNNLGYGVGHGQDAEDINVLPRESLLYHLPERVIESDSTPPEGFPEAMREMMRDEIGPWLQDRLAEYAVRMRRTPPA